MSDGLLFTGLLEALGLDFDDPKDNKSQVMDKIENSLKHHSCTELIMKFDIRRRRHLAWYSYRMTGSGVPRTWRRPSESSNLSWWRPWVCQCRQMDQKASTVDPQATLIETISQAFTPNRRDDNDDTHSTAYTRITSVRSSCITLPINIDNQYLRSCDNTNFWH
ncbi:hypothetical protein CONLIGDRAFT_694136 [Coniochaeta ligniaria NRRL 30616]|uniref:Uncharacterized protein n=1 Tax=Coniochaeta ligniaria NRRL 30616 TaxID=1408157 RepID=A0A1J7J6P6_9PEZI|nr:hypothetical protein CONLIGDRAFT_694136 [Coniochaeta ligniaria NRRL 30616]